MTKKISFQGELGAYSHLACSNSYPTHTPLACRTFEDTLAAVNTEEAELAMIPIENSVAGRVADIHYLLGGYDLKIYAEHFQEIHHQLLIKQDSDLNKVKNVRSHAMAIGQCHDVIQSLSLQPIVMADTAGAAKFISEQGTAEDAAIASSLAADIYGLKTIKANIEDAPFNTTRFLIMAKDKQQPRQENTEYLTSCIFEVRSVPAALYKALGGFATHGVNLAKLESFIMKGDFNRAMFYIDIEGHVEDSTVKGALEELDYYTNKIITLGVYPKHEYRNHT
ncbi:MAG: prephenate dehydratase [bacterium]|nr:prephenate dehydratase [bacterium]MBU1918426.1 prephenate dehydratase [bacterium]